MPRTIKEGRESIQEFVVHLEEMSKRVGKHCTYQERLTQCEFVVSSHYYYYYYYSIPWEEEKEEGKVIHIHIHSIHRLHDKDDVVVHLLYIQIALGFPDWGMEEGLLLDEMINDYGNDGNDDDHHTYILRWQDWHNDQSVYLLALDAVLILDQTEINYSSMISSSFINKINEEWDYIPQFIACEKRFSTIGKPASIAKCILSKVNIIGILFTMRTIPIPLPIIIDYHHWPSSYLWNMG